jgi:preprotein translocase subunit SecD
VDLPGLKDPERIKKLIATEGRLELVHVISPPSPSPIQTFKNRDEALDSMGGTIPDNRRLVSYSDSYDAVPGRSSWVIIDALPIIAGTEIKSASTVPSSHSGAFHVAFTLKPEGAKKFGEWTAANINEYLAVVLNGEVKSIAFIKSQIFDAGEISGRFTKESAEDLAQVLNSGPLPGPLKFVKEEIDADH